MLAWLYCVVVLTVIHVLTGGSLSPEESGWLAFVAAFIAYVGLGVKTIYKLARHRHNDALYQWQLRPLTRVLIAVACVLLISLIAGVTNAPGLALVVVVPLLPMMLGIDGYVRRHRNGGDGHEPCSHRARPPGGV